MPIKTSPQSNLPPGQPNLAPAPSKKPSTAAIKAELDLLKHRWPLSVGANRPLAIGSGKDIVGTAITEGRVGRVVRLAVHRHANSLRYLNAVAAEDSRRVDLEGGDADPVSDEHRLHAVDAIRGINTQILEKKHRSKAKDQKGFGQ